ncbi:telomerase reverse transcriptase isoform X2 [Brienomyrus brachyistius]|uniref:telomerase reverse transcriptase isoform X2 n=1 Tax=Brienomyrus brachyistius TaxID=42636 RepID=UPI0020B45663|nr:telomerase reverse transcriptase isoform X2 [Brienomyrus brachyistius]
MASSDVTRVLRLIRSVYPIVQTAQEFSDTVVFKEGRKLVLVEPSDSARYGSFIEGLVICSDRVLQHVPSCTQVITLAELLALVLNTLKRRRRKNVLSQGYSLYEGKQMDADVLKFHGNISLSAAYVYHSDFWKKLHSRVGTDLTRYLLESCTVFTTVPPSCLLQVCGPPFYDCVPAGPGSDFQLSRLRSAHGAAKPRLGQATGDRRMRERRRRVRKRRRSRGEAGEEGEAQEDKEPLSKRARLEVMGFKPTATRRPRLAPTFQKDGPSGIKFPPLRPTDCFFRVLRLLYGGRGMGNFLLNRKLRVGSAAPRRLQGRDLVRLVFFEGPVFGSSTERKSRRLPVRFHGTLGLFAALLRRHRGCPYVQLLRRTCPVGDTDADVTVLLTRHSTPRQVYLFVRECLHRVVPEEFWGSSHNRVHFLLRVKRFLSMGKFDRLSLSELLWKMRVNDCDWLKVSKTGRCPASEHRYREHLLSRFLAWLLDRYVMGLVRALFYVTESAGQKNALRFYRDRVWVKLQDQAFGKHILRSQWELLPQQHLPKATVVSRLRFIPKPGGMRPIARMARADSRTWVFQSRIKDLHDFLRFCIQKRPTLLGSTVFSVRDIHQTLGPFAALHKEKPRPLYFVKVDVSGAYDSLPHDKLLQVVTEVLFPIWNEAFVIRWWAQVWSETNEGMKRAFRRRRYSLNTNGKDVFEFFKQMLANYVIQFGKKMFRQCHGIPQGSVVSALLCCLCYGHMENSLFHDITDGGGCLLRLVDDFLLITPEFGKAQMFLKSLLAGVPEYGCFANPTKVAVNFPVDDMEGIPSVRQLPFQCLFPWCGLLLDTDNLDVYHDYSSYAGLSLRSSLTLGSSPFPGQHMKRKLLSILKLKCLPILLDLKMNSLQAVYLNIYKIALLQAHRFHACVQNLPFGQKVKNNPRFFEVMIWNMAKLCNLLIRRNNLGDHLGFRNMGGCLQFEAVELMFCISFLTVLSRHRRLYKCLLPQLRTRKRRLERKLGVVRLAIVQRASTPEIPEDFRCIYV